MSTKCVLPLLVALAALAIASTEALCMNTEVAKRQGIDTDLYTPWSEYCIYQPPQLPRDLTPWPQHGIDPIVLFPFIAMILILILINVALALR
ncbi:unnamed protein product [Sphagnum tenellum]